MDLSPTCKTCLESFHWNTSMNELPWKNDQNMPSTWQLPCNNDTKLKKYLASKLLFVVGKKMPDAETSAPKDAILTIWPGRAKNTR